MLDDVHGQGGFAHRGTRRENDHFTGVQPVGHLVEDAEPGGQTADAAALLVHFLDVFQRGEDLVAHVGGALAEARLADGENLALHVVEQLRHIALLLVTAGGRRRAGRDHAAQEGFLEDDVEVVRGVGRGGHVTEQIGHRTRTTDRIEQVQVAQAVGQGYDIDLLVAGPHLDEDAVDRPVSGGVERFLRDLLGTVVEHLAGCEQDGTEQAFLRVDILRQRAVRIGGR